MPRPLVARVKRGGAAVAFVLLSVCTAAALPASPSGAKAGFGMEHVRRLRRVYWPALSPDGSAVAYTLGGKEIWTSPTAGGPARRVAWDGGWVAGLAWLPDGTGLSFQARDGQGAVRVWSLSFAEGMAWPLSPRGRDVTEYAWSPDGRRLALLIEEASGGERGPLSSAQSAGVPVDMSFEGADLRDVLLFFSKLSGLSFVLDPDVQGTVHARFHRKPWDEAFERLLEARGLSYELSGGVVRVGRRAALGLDEPAQPPRGVPIVVDGLSFKREGVGYLPPRGVPGLVVRDVKRVSELVVPGIPEGARGLAWSPDGKLLAFAAAGRANELGASWDVYVAWSFGWDVPRNLTDSPLNEDSPSFAPDSQKLVYRIDVPPGGSPAVTHRLEAVDVFDEERRVVLAALDREILEPRVPRGSRHAWFLLPDAGRVKLARVPLEGGRVEMVSDGWQEVRQFDVGGGGQAVLVSSTWSRPDAVFLLEPGGGTRPVASPNARVVRGLGLRSAQRITAHARGGPAVDAFVLPPRRPRRDGSPRPAVVWLHGGPYSQHTASFDPLLHLLSEAGLAVVLPNPRGSSGRGRAFGSAIWSAWGTKDREDVMAVVDEAVRQGLVDGGHLGVGGWSYGGWLTNHLLTRTDRFKAAVSGGGLSNMLAWYGTTDATRWTVREFGLPWRNTGRYIAASPLFGVERVRTPTLVLCGEEDMRTPVGQSEQWYHALKGVGVQAQLVIYPGEGHTPDTEAWNDAMERIVAWYTRLLGPPARLH